MRVSAPDSEIKKEYENGGGSFSEGYCESICVYREISKKMIDFDGFLFHAAVVAVDGKAYAFAAKSGTGKSTHTNLWLRHFGERAVIVNGDKPIFRCIENEFVAYGTPWCGKERLETNMSAPVKAICFIERGTENHIVRADSSEICRRIFNQFIMPDDPLKRVRFLGIIEKMIKQVPVYVLNCNISDDAVVTAYNMMAE